MSWAVSLCRLSGSYSANALRSDAGKFLFLPIRIHVPDIVAAMAGAGAIAVVQVACDAAGVAYWWPPPDRATPQWRLVSAGTAIESGYLVTPVGVQGKGRRSVPAQWTDGLGFGCYLFPSGRAFDLRLACFDRQVAPPPILKPGDCHCVVSTGWWLLIEGCCQ